MPFPKLPLLASALLLCLAPVAAADSDGQVADGCIKFDPDTLLPYYDADCARLSAEGEPAPDEGTQETSSEA